jgi:hypothetical protein
MPQHGTIHDSLHNAFSFGLFAAYELEFESISSPVGRVAKSSTPERSLRLERTHAAKSFFFVSCAIRIILRMIVLLSIALAATITRGHHR